MHIPDGFLSTPVWASLAAVSLPAVGYMARQSQDAVEEQKLPLLGVMGAFVFAAQMINFPVGLGTSGHLVGGALLAHLLGPAAASLVMTAILLVQALIFQDGGVLALGANICNMALVGVWMGTLPMRLLGSGSARWLGLFAGGMLSVLMSACLALSELLLSGVMMPATLVGVSLGLFLVSATLEGVITVVVVRAIARIHPRAVPNPAAIRQPVLLALATIALLLVVVGVLWASRDPDGLEHLAEQLGLAGKATTLLATPLADYEMSGLASPWLRKAVAGLIGIGAVTLLIGVLSRLLRPARTQQPESSGKG